MIPRSPDNLADIGDNPRPSPPIDSALVMVIRSHCAPDIMLITVPLQPHIWHFKPIVKNLQHFSAILYRTLLGHFMVIQKLLLHGTLC